MSLARVIGLSAFTAGVILGLASTLGPSRNASAITESLTLRVHPGPEARFATLTCSWHSVCVPFSPGNALDWANGHQQYAPNRPIYWRSWGYRSGGTGTIAYGRIVQNDTAFCYRVDVNVRDVFGFAKGFVRYTHSRTWTPGWDFGVTASPGWSFTRNEIGFSVAAEKSASCPWTGQHLHQEAEPAYWSANWPNFGSTGATYDAEATASWQYQQSWNWNY